LTAFSYTGAPFPLREDIVLAQCRAWERLARPGSWWTGAERVAIAAETRNARACALCLERREALSPEAVRGEHDRRGGLPPAAVEAIHRIATDPGRLSRRWCQRVLADGLSDGHYVELVGVLVTVLSIDAFHRGLGLDPEPLPEPVAGEPTRYRPARAADEGAYVPMLPVGGARGDEADLWQAPRVGNVIRALSLVPDAVRDLADLAASYYLPVAQVANPAASGGRAIDRSQIELLAGRVSALNECFY
jgi:hypothetical protein